MRSNKKSKLLLFPSARPVQKSKFIVVTNMPEADVYKF